MLCNTFYLSVGMLIIPFLQTIPIFISMCTKCYKRISIDHTHSCPPNFWDTEYTHRVYTQSIHTESPKMCVQSNRCCLCTFLEVGSVYDHNARAAQHTLFPKHVAALRNIHRYSRCSNYLHAFLLLKCACIVCV